MNMHTAVIIMIVISVFAQMGLCSSSNIDASNTWPTWPSKQAADEFLNIYDWYA